MARYLKSPIYIIKNPRNVLLNSQKKKFLETFLLVVHFSHTVFFYRKKTKKKYQKYK